MSLHLRQADPRWGSRSLGGSQLTIGRHGCLLCALVTAHSAFAPGGLALHTPDTAETLLRQHSAFAGGLVITELAGEALGLSTSRADRITIEDGEDSLRARLRTTLERGHLALVHVDHDEHLPHGDAAGDHWVLALRLELVDEHLAPGDVRVVQEAVCADSATGEEVRLDLRTLRGVARWGHAPRQYQVRAVQPVAPVRR